jgi:hypothetical protein
VVTPEDFLRVDGLLERLDAQPRGRGSGADDHEQRTLPEERDKGEGSRVAILSMLIHGMDDVRRNRARSARYERG